MTYTNVTASNLRKAAWKAIYTSLNGNITGISTRVYGSYPLKEAQLPLIVIENPAKGENDAGLGDNNILGREVGIIVNVYAKQAEKIDTYVDAVEAQIISDRADFNTYGLYLPTDGIADNEGSGPFEDASGNRVHSKSITVILRA